MSEHALWNEMGNLYFLNGNFERAIQSYQTAIALAVDIGEPYHNLALTFTQTGRYAEAVEQYSRSIQLFADGQRKAMALRRLGYVQFHLQHYPQALEAFQQADFLQPDWSSEARTEPVAADLLTCIPHAISDSAPEGLSPNLVTETDQLDSRSGMGLLPLIEELTPWWFDGQVWPDEEPPVFDNWLEDELTFSDFDEPTSPPEPLKWEAAAAYQSTMTQTGLQAEAPIPIYNTAQPESDSFELQATTLNPSGLQDQVMHSEAEGASHSASLVLADETIKVGMLSASPAIITDPPEFLAETMAVPLVEPYESPAELPIVSLTEEERASILVEIEKYKGALDKNPRNPFTWDALGGQYKALGQYEEAIQAFQKAVSLDSSKAHYYYHLGLVYAALGRYEDAIHVFEKVLEIDPHHSLAHATLGGYYRRNGMEDLAQTHIARARELLAPDESEYNLACMESICGNKDRSLELLEIALKNKQTYVNWAGKDPDLDFIRSDPRFHSLLAAYTT